MAQQPAKIEWRRSFPHGLSASQFGMALGFSGKVSDYVNYLRNVVGTDLEFKGNTFTDHGIATESKARSLYEILTGSEVHNGGFFVTDDRVLGCSPDGRSFYYEEEVLAGRSTDCTATTTGDASSPGTDTGVSATNSASSLGGGLELLSLSSSSASLNTVPSGGGRPSVAVRIPFKRPRGAENGGDAESGVRHVRERITICRRKTRLLEIKSPFRSLYDGSKPERQPFGIPLHYMCQMQGQMALTHATECDFFVYLDFPRCQVQAWRVHFSEEFWLWAEPKLRQVSAWVKNGLPPHIDRSFSFEPFNFSSLYVEPLVFPFCITTGVPLRDPYRFAFFHRHAEPAYPAVYQCIQNGSKRLPELSARELIAYMVQTPAVQFLFNTCDAGAGWDDDPREVRLNHDERNDDAIISALNPYDEGLYESGGFLTQHGARKRLFALERVTPVRTFVTDLFNATSRHSLFPESRMALLSGEADAFSGSGEGAFRVSLYIPFSFENGKVYAKLVRPDSEEPLGAEWVDPVGIRFFHYQLFAPLVPVAASVQPSLNAEVTPPITHQEGLPPTSDAHYECPPAPDSVVVAPVSTAAKTPPPTQLSGSFVRDSADASSSPSVNLSQTLRGGSHSIRYLSCEELCTVVRCADDCSDAWLINSLEDEVVHCCPSTHAAARSGAPSATQFTLLVGGTQTLLVFDAAARSGAAAPPSWHSTVKQLLTSFQAHHQKEQEFGFVCVYCFCSNCPREVEHCDVAVKHCFIVPTRSPEGCSRTIEAVKHAMLSCTP